jgi:hypothetical protein
MFGSQRGPLIGRIAGERGRGAAIVTVAASTGELGSGRYAAPLTADCAGAVWKIAAVATARELLLGRSWAS